jgi:hypothetical protein
MFRKKMYIQILKRYGSTDESTNQDGHISSSMDNKLIPAPLSAEEKELDVTNDSIMPSESPSISKDSTQHSRLYLLPSRF